MTAGACSAAGSSAPTTRYHVVCVSHSTCPSTAATAMSALLLVCMQGVVARGDVPGRAEGPQRRLLERTDLGRVAAARVEAATRRRGHRARHVAGEHDALAARLEPRVG